MERMIKKISVLMLILTTITILGQGTLAKPVFSSSSSRSGSDGTVDGTNDATADFHHENGHGYADSCPSGHSDTYCEAYTRAYRDQWAVLENSGKSS
jgi:hypothetical protein